MLTVLNVIGTRPEAIKMAPVIHVLRDSSDSICSLVCSTGQHAQLLDDVFRLFDINPDYDLAVMQHDQSLSSMTARLLEAVDKVVVETSPDWILAQGDTTSVMVAALIAFYHRIPFGHVEAGLRTGNRYSPFPEEVNRIVTDNIAELLFAPTHSARQQLIDEGYDKKNIVTTGNTVVDALQLAAEMPYCWLDGPLSDIPRDKRVVLVTAHRRESFGPPIDQICKAVKILADKFAPDGVHFVYPVHPNPNLYDPVNTILGGSSNISLLPPLDYLSLINLLREATLVLTDSGGIQEEAPAFNKPVLVLRNETERKEGLTAGVARLVGTSTNVIVDAVSELLTDRQAYDAMTHPRNPYGDGKAAERIAQAILVHNSISADEVRLFPYRSHEVVSGKF